MLTVILLHLLIFFPSITYKILRYYLRIFLNIVFDVMMIDFYLKNNAYNKINTFVQAIKRCISKEMEFRLKNFSFIVLFVVFHINIYF